jgi:hypothetical protein
MCYKLGLRVIPSLLLTMSIPVRPQKRRRTRKDRPLQEGDPEAAEFVTMEHVEVTTRRGTVIKTVLVPLEPSGPEERTVLPVQDRQNLTDYPNVDMEQNEQTFVRKRNMVRNVTV